MNRHLHRTGDGETSAMAAASIDTSLSEKHKRALTALVAVCPATDLEMAIALSNLGFGREEACRRLVRTLREEHGRLVPALDRDGEQIRHLNPTGRWAEAWIPGYAPPPRRRPDDEFPNGDIEVDSIDVDPDGSITLRGRILDPDLVAALTRGNLDDVTIEPATLF